MGIHWLGMAVRAYGDMTLSRCMITDNDSSSTALRRIHGRRWHCIEAKDCPVRAESQRVLRTIFWRGLIADLNRDLHRLHDRRQHERARRSGSMATTSTWSRPRPTIFLFNCIGLATRRSSSADGGCTGGRRSQLTSRLGRRPNRYRDDLSPRATELGLSRRLRPHAASICADADRRAPDASRRRPTTCLETGGPSPRSFFYIIMGAYKLRLPKLLPTVYVLPGGGDDPLLGDGSMTRPFATITYALGAFATAARCAWMTGGTLTRCASRVQ